MTVYQSLALPQGWPPRAQDVWADRDGAEYVAHVYDVGDEERCSMLAVSREHSITPDYLFETKHPLRLVAAGWARSAGR